MEYNEQLKTREWYYVRERVLERDGYRCAVCRTGKNLQVHHMYYLAGKKAWEYNDSALTTLCDACHKKEHQKQIGRLKPNRLDEALERLVIVASGVCDWCLKQFPEDDGKKTL